MQGKKTFREVFLQEERELLEEGKRRLLNIEKQQKESLSSPKQIAKNAAEHEQRQRRRSRLYERARKWAARRTREDLEHAVGRLLVRDSMDEGKAFRVFTKALADMTNQLTEIVTDDAIRWAVRGNMMDVEHVVRRGNARAAAYAKQEKNPEAKAKANAIEASRVLWQERETGMHPKLRTEDQFAMEVARRWPILAMSATMKRSTQWRKDKALESGAPSALRNKKVKRSS